MRRPSLPASCSASVGGAGIAIVARRLRGADGPSVSSTFASRNARLARLGARAGGREAVPAAQGVFASAARREANWTAAWKSATPRTSPGNSEQMKGALMKLGQMVSYLDEGLPEHVRTALAELQQDAPPMSVELAAATIEQELGAPPDSALRRVGSRSDRRGVDRSGAPRRHAETAGPWR